MTKEAECATSASGEHEPDFERLEFVRYVTTTEAELKTKCLHCGAEGKTRVASDEFTYDINFVGGATE